MMYRLRIPVAHLYNEPMTKNYEAITCKVAIYTPDGGKVLIVEYTNNVGYGLPGGHLEKDEEPIAACMREVREELGVALSAESLVLKESWRHPDGKIILGYVSSLSENEPMNRIDRVEILDIHWVGIEAIRSESISVGTYKQFIIDNWPV